jgi:hypothetical protein
MTRHFRIIALLGLVACSSKSHDPQAILFGPPEAESEIRAALGIRGALPTIDELIERADRRHMNHETRVYDRSVTYCQRGRNMDHLNLEMFYAGRDETRHAALNYLVVYAPDRRVVCIETRHAYRGL